MNTNPEQGGQDRYPLVASLGLPTDRALTALELSKALHVSLQTVTNMIERGELPVRRVGRSRRFLASDIEQMLEGGTDTHRYRPEAVA